MKKPDLFRVLAAGTKPSVGLILALEQVCALSVWADMAFQIKQSSTDLGSVTSRVYELDRPFSSLFLSDEKRGAPHAKMPAVSDGAASTVELEMLVDMALRTGDWADAQTHLEELCQLRPDMALNWARLGGAYLRLRKPDRAREVLDKALALDAREPVAVYNMGILLVADQRMDEAAPFFAPERSYTLGQLASWSAVESAGLIDLIGETGYQCLAQQMLSGGRHHTAFPGTVESTTSLLKRVSGGLWQAHVAQQEERWADAHEALAQVFEAGAVAPSVRQDMLYYAYRAGLDDQPVPELKTLALESGQLYALTIAAMISLEQDKAWQALDLLALGSLRSNETVMITAAAQAKLGHKPEALQAWATLNPEVQAHILQKFAKADFLSALRELLSD